MRVDRIALVAAKAALRNLRMGNQSVGLFFEVYRCHVLTDAATERCHFYMFGVDGVGIKSLSVAKLYNQPGVIRTR
jgi:hypothetical protein